MPWIDSHNFGIYMTVAPFTSKCLSERTRSSDGGSRNTFRRWIYRKMFFFFFKLFIRYECCNHWCTYYFIRAKLHLESTNAGKLTLKDLTKALMRLRIDILAKLSNLSTNVTDFVSYILYNSRKFTVPDTDHRNMAAWTSLPELWLQFVSSLLFPLSIISFIETLTAKIS